MSVRAPALLQLPSLHEVAREIYLLHHDISQPAVTEFLQRVRDYGQVEDLVAWAAKELLNKARLQANQPIYAKAHALRERLTVEPAPAGYHPPASPIRSPLVQIVPVPVAALREVLALKVRIGDGKLRLVRDMTRAELMLAAEQLKKTAAGCQRNADLLLTMASYARLDERAIDAVRRLERGER